MAEISKIQRAVEMSDANKKAFVDLIKTCNGAITKNGNLYLSKNSNGDIGKELRKCSQLDSGLANAIMLIYGRPNLDNIDYAKLDIMDPKDQGLIKELRAMLNEEKISEAIALSEELLESDDLPGVKGLLGKGIDDIKSHLQKFRPIWQKYQEYAEPVNESGERVSRNEMEIKLAYDKNRVLELTEQIEMREEELQRLKKRKTRIEKEITGIKDLLGGGTREQVEKVVGADVFQFPQGAAKSPTIPEGAEIAPGEQLVADMVSGRGVVKAIKKGADEKDNVTPLRRGEEKDIPDDIA